MIIDSARPKAPTASPARGMNRRQLMKAGAWAAPALVAAVAVPAAVASAGTVPIGQFTVEANDLGNDNTGGTPGPITWQGGQIAWGNAPQTGPTIAPVSYTVILTGPGGLSVPLVPAGVANIPRGQAHVFPAVTYGTKPMAGGLYTVTLTAFADGGSSSAQKSVTLAAPPPTPVTASHAVIPVANGNKHDVTLTLTGTPGTVVTIGINSWEVNWGPAFPSTATIGANGTVVVSANANARGRTPGGLNITLSSSVPVNPNGFSNVVIPV